MGTDLSIFSLIKNFEQCMVTVCHPQFIIFLKFLSYPTFSKIIFNPNVCDPPSENQPRNTILKYSGRIGEVPGCCHANNCLDLSCRLCTSQSPTEGTLPLSMHYEYVGRVRLFIQPHCPPPHPPTLYTLPPSHPPTP